MTDNAHTFWTMHGLGNKIVVLDLRRSNHVVQASEAEAIAADPATDFDQLMVLHAAEKPGTEASIRIYNRDGSRAGACGNGMRCVGLVVSKELPEPRPQLYTVDGQELAVGVRSEDLISVDMGEPRFGWEDIPLAEEFRDTRYIELQIGPIDAPVLHSPSVLNMGNPHAVFWVEDVDAYDLGKFGPLLENHPIFPDRANISIAHVVSSSHLRVRTWERGVGLTEACGSAACASLVAAARTKRSDRKATVTVPGGDLHVHWDSGNRVIMTGPARHVRHGDIQFIEGGRAPVITPRPG
ncbi:MAG: diaminopimelate epimerase [Pseudomonadota bacterium]